MEYTKGSEWAKWDLQVQTIIDDGYVSLEEYYAGLKEQNEDKWGRYVAKVGGEENALKFDSKKYFSDTSVNEEKRCHNYVRNLFYFLSEFRTNLRLIGITDHNYRHNALIDILYKYSTKSDIKAICGVEINASGVHMLVYFDTFPYDKESMSEGINTFLSKIEIHNPITNRTLTVSPKSVLDVIKEVISQNGIYIFPHCNSDNGLFQERGRTDRTHLADIYNYKPSVLLQSKSKESADQTLEFIKNRGELLKSTPIFTISNDSRCLKDIGIGDSSDNLTWIKANPTFEGLRQIVFEGTERVRIQEYNPQENYKKPFFSEICVEGTSIFDDSDVAFSETTFPLNPNLVAIIGGRGTGKSLLLDAIGNTFSKVEGKLGNRAKKIIINPDDFIITYQKSDGDQIQYNIRSDNNLDYLHIHQGEVMDIVNPDSSEKLDEEIKKLLSISSIEDISRKSIESQSSVEDDVQELAESELPIEDNVQQLTESEVERLIDEIFEIKNWLHFKDKDGNLINSLEYNEKRKKEKKDLIETVTTIENREKIEQFTSNLEKINKINGQIQKTTEILGMFTDFKKSMDQMIKELNENTTGETQIPFLDFQDQIPSLNQLKSEQDVLKNELIGVNSEIEAELKDKGIKEDIPTLLDKIEKYQHDISSYDYKIKEAELKAKELSKKFLKIGIIADSISKSHQEYMHEIDSKWIQLKKGKDDWNQEQKELIKDLLFDIDIKAVEMFDSKKLYEKLSEYLNSTKFRETQSQTKEERFKEKFQIENQEDFVALLKNEKMVNVDDVSINLEELLDKEDLFNKYGTKELLRHLLLAENRTKYWNIQSKSTYKGKEIRQLSVGMRGTFYVCLKLATDPFIKPFVFDQPEDDLDNEFIMNSLVPIFKKIKKYRQVIIVTHNANLVVNADAEQVIVAKNDNEVLSYESGAIENPTTRKQICNILEGGESAFMMREKKYGFANI